MASSTSGSARSPDNAKEEIAAAGPKNNAIVAADPAPSPVSARLKKQATRMACSSASARSPKTPDEETAVNRTAAALDPKNNAIVAADPAPSSPSPVSGSLKKQGNKRDILSPRKKLPAGVSDIRRKLAGLGACLSPASIGVVTDVAE